MKQERRNVLFLLFDALRADKCLGDGRTAKTPAIDSLVHRGAVFTQAIATTSTTSPSVASVLTGLYPPRHGIRSLMGYKLSSDARTCAEILAANGYNTYAEVTGPLLPEIGLDRGFDAYNCRDKAGSVHSEWGEELVRRFEREEFEEPWFVFVHFWELHAPRTVPRRFDRNRYGRNRYERALSALDTYLERLLGTVDRDAMIVLHSDHGEKVAETKIEELFLKGKMIASRATRRIGLTKGDILKATGHGFHIYDYLVRIPLVFVGNGIFPKNTVVGEQVSQVDVLPTLVDGLEMDVKDDFNPDGRSLMPAARGKRVEVIPVFCEACGAIVPDRSKWLVGIRTPEYKFVYGPYSREVEEELYDLKRDPQETRNVVKEFPRIARVLREALERRRYILEEKTRVMDKIRRIRTSKVV